MSITGRTKRIAVAIDFTPASDAALLRAVSLARALSAELDVLHVWEAPIGIAAPGFLIPDAYSDATARAELDGEIARLAAQGVPARPHLLTGAAADEILRFTVQNELELLVMGTHGRRGIGRLALGSVAEHVLREASCPVVTVRAHDPPRHAEAAPHRA